MNPHLDELLHIRRVARLTWLAMFFAKRRPGANRKLALGSVRRRLRPHVCGEAASRPWPSLRHGRSLRNNVPWCHFLDFPGIL